MHGRPQLRRARALYLSKLFSFSSLPFSFLRLVAQAMSRYRLCTGMLFGSECSSREVASPSRQSAQTLAAKGAGAQPAEFYANERSLGGGSTERGRERGNLSVSGQKWSFRPVSQFRPAPIVRCREKSSVVGRKASRESWRPEALAWELRAKSARRLRYPPESLKIRRRN